MAFMDELDTLDADVNDMLENGSLFIPMAGENGSLASPEPLAALPPSLSVTARVANSWELSVISLENGSMGLENGSGMSLKGSFSSAKGSTSMKGSVTSAVWGEEL